MKRPELNDITDVVPKGEPLHQDHAELRKKNADCALVVTPHPITLQGQRVLDAATAALLPGETLATFLQRHGVVRSSVRTGCAASPNWRRHCSDTSIDCAGCDEAAELHRWSLTSP
ncbi:MAG: hypothetical protein ABL896_19980 [Hylemonella sp.]